MASGMARRFNAFLLALVFVGGSLGLPALDATLFHGSSRQAQGPHYDPAGGCGDHSERCTLATAIAATQLPALSPTPSVVVTSPVLRFIAPSTDRPVAAQALTLPLSRAPPLLPPRG